MTKSTLRRRTARRHQRQPKTDSRRSALTSRPTLRNGVGEKEEILNFQIAATPDANNRGYVRQKQAGKLWVRERVEQLLDPGSFQEVGSVSGTVKWKQLSPIKEEPVDFVPSNNVQGV
jgi:acetyl-CoA carboxylase carboxyltransferase component